MRRVIPYSRHRALKLLHTKAACANSLRWSSTVRLSHGIAFALLFMWFSMPLFYRRTVYHVFTHLYTMLLHCTHCSPAKALRYHKAPRVEQSPTPTICRERVRLNFIAISQFCRRGGAWLRPGLSNAGPCVSPRLPSHKSRTALFVWQLAQRHILRCDLA